MTPSLWLSVTGRWSLHASSILMPIKIKLILKLKYLKIVVIQLITVVIAQ